MNSEKLQVNVCLQNLYDRTRCSTSKGLDRNVDTSGCMDKIIEFYDPCLDSVLSQPQFEQKET